MARYDAAHTGCAPGLQPETPEQAKQRLGLYSIGSYYYNVWGEGEFWLKGKRPEDPNGYWAADPWYYLLRDGRLYRYCDRKVDPRQDPLVARLPGESAGRVELWIYGPATGLKQLFSLFLTDSDQRNFSGVKDERHFRSSRFPAGSSDFYIEPDGSVYHSVLPMVEAIRNGWNPVIGKLTPAEHQDLSWVWDTAQVKKQLGIRYIGSRYDNLWGLKERWFIRWDGGSAPTRWYYLLPDGALYELLGSVGGMLKTDTFVTKLNPEDYINASSWAGA